MRRWLDLARLLAVVLVLLLHSRVASAHAIGVSRGTYHATAAGLEVELVFAERELAGAFVERAALLRDVAVSAGDARCTPALVGASPTERDGVRVAARYACARSGPIRVVWNAVDRLPHGHRHVARAGGGIETVLFGAERSFELAREAVTAPGPAPGAVVDWIVLGVHHIVTGYDHLVFLLALVLVAQGAVSLIRVVSCFTLAHSLTLAAAALGLVAPPESVVEPAIALSIAYVGVENLIAKRWNARALIVFAFGLVHGFGFAGVLSQVEIPSDELPAALVLFNVGVELGQLAVISAAYPLVRKLATRPWFGPRLVPACSAIVVALGLGWFFERILGG